MNKVKFKYKIRCVIWTVLWSFEPESNQRPLGGCWVISKTLLDPKTIKTWQQNKIRNKKKDLP